MGTILGRVKGAEHDVRILLMPDHATPIATGSHSTEKVPFLLFDSTKPEKNTLPFDERAVHDTDLIVEHTPDLMKMLLSE